MNLFGAIVKCYCLDLECPVSVVLWIGAFGKQPDQGVILISDPSIDEFIAGCAVRKQDLEGGGGSLRHDLKRMSLSLVPPLLLSVSSHNEVDTFAPLCPSVMIFFHIPSVPYMKHWRHKPQWTSPPLTGGCWVFCPSNGNMTNTR